MKFTFVYSMRRGLRLFSTRCSYVDGISLNEPFFQTGKRNYNKHGTQLSGTESITNGKFVYFTFILIPIFHIKVLTFINIFSGFTSL